MLNCRSQVLRESMYIEVACLQQVNGSVIRKARFYHPSPRCARRVPTGPAHSADPPQPQLAPSDGLERKKRSKRTHKQHESRAVWPFSQIADFGPIPARILRFSIFIALPLGGKSELSSWLKLGFQPFRSSFFFKTALYLGPVAVCPTHLADTQKPLNTQPSLGGPA